MNRSVVTGARLCSTCRGEILAVFVVVALASVTSSFFPCAARAAEAPTSDVRIDQTVDVAPAWSGHYVGFSLLTHGQSQLVAFYDADRRMTVGSRRLDSTEWHLARLPLASDELARKQRRPPKTTLAWDSHNSITMAVDGDDCLHVSGNMHASPLVYFRSTRPMDLDSLRWQPAMTGQRERKVTYPQFLAGPSGELVFAYRDGGSGNGDQMFNRYGLKTRAWSRLFDAPLFTGRGKMNAYFTGPIRDESGVFHISWIWRDTPDCATNHDVSYARSRDLIHWTTSDGKPTSLPIAIDTGEIVDPAPSGSGLNNGGPKIGFDSKGRVVLSYYRFDARGNTQLFNARREEQGWKVYQTSDWDYRWDLCGTGSIAAEIRVGPVSLDRRENLTQFYQHVKHGSGTWQLDEASLKPVGDADPTAQRNPTPPELNRVESTDPGLKVNFASDLGDSDEPGVRYLLRWESRPPNRDKPYPGEPPKPAMLRVYKLRSPLPGGVKTAQ